LETAFWHIIETSKGSPSWLEWGLVILSHILSIENLSKTHPGKGNDPLFSAVTAELEEPGIIALLGASGQGKSTLLRILAMLDRQDEGEIRLHNKPVSEWKPQVWRTRVCYVAQQAVMLPGTVEDNLRTVSDLHGSAFDRPLAEQLMAQAGLAAIDWGKTASDLSGGEKQRVALVRSLLLRPDILLLDEITASLDMHSRQAIEGLLDEWFKREGTSMIWVTHDLDQARRVSGRVWFMADRTLLENEPAAVFFGRPATEAARRFLQRTGDEGESVCQP
jgi:putative ABC transport system ATP-binding protein